MFVLRFRNGDRVGFSSKFAIFQTTAVRERNNRIERRDLRQKSIMY